jgi:acetoacetyl-CoA reductase
MMLQGKTAIVTGASRGIGKAIALELAVHGANVVVNYHNHKEQADEVVRLIEAKGGLAFAQRADVTRKEEVKALVGETEASWPGSLAILINNAGITADRTLKNMGDADWHKVIEVNLHGTYNTTAAALPVLMARSFGRIINISSVIGQSGGFGQTNYAASKAGLVGFTKSLALETARHNITVNAVCPGFVETEMVQAMPKEVLGKLIDKIPLRRLARTDEVAHLVRFLVMEGDYITGQQFNINGGLYV